MQTIHVKLNDVVRPGGHLTSINTPGGRRTDSASISHDRARLLNWQPPTTTFIPRVKGRNAGCSCAERCVIVAPEHSLISVWLQLECPDSAPVCVGRPHRRLELENKHLNWQKPDYTWRLSYRTMTQICLLCFKVIQGFNPGLWKWLFELLHSTNYLLCGEGVY